MEEIVQTGSNLNPLALVFLVLMSVVVLLSNRQTAIGAFLLTAAIIPLGQQLVVFGFHLHFLRLLLLVGLFRALARRETAGFTMNLIDRLFVYWASVGVVCGVLRGAGAETFGSAYNALATYFLIRVLMDGPEDALDHLRLLALVILVIGACMIFEVVTSKNPFYIFGGVPEVLQERGDRVRCQGPFRSPILAGTFAATLFPLMAGLWLQGGRGKLRAVLGALGCVIATVLSNSSGALLCLVAAVIGFALWPMRERMHLFRRGAVAVIIGLALVMKAPVWYVISRVSDLIGGGGWHRSYVIDIAVKNFSDWWLLGTSRTADWSPDYQVLLVDPDNIDITNHYVFQGVRGGVIMLVLFLAIIVFCFKTLGRGVRADLDLPLNRKFLWAIGIALAAHCTAFISVSYFDQISVFWFWLLAVVSSLSFRSLCLGAEKTLQPANQAADDYTALPSVDEVVPFVCGFERSVTSVNPRS